MKRITVFSLICVLLALCALSFFGCDSSTLVEGSRGAKDYSGDSSVLTDNESSNLSMARIFANGMVLQREEPINIYGYATTGSTVTVTLGENSTSAVAADGEWRVTLPAMEATRGLTLTVESADRRLSFVDVSIGEVFVVSGQSNAQYFACQLEDWDEIARLAETLDNIKVYAETSTWDMHPSDYGYGTWIKATRANLEADGPVKGNVSAVGYVMATKLAAELGPDVDVALINVCRSGTKITAWFPAEELYKDPTTHADDIARYEDYLAFWDANGRWPQSTAESKYYQSGNPYSYIPTLSYNAMIAPIKGYTARAVIWYQGESDAGISSVYTGKFGVLRELYSNAFANDDIPFFVVQLAPYNTDVNTLATMEAVQYDLTVKYPNTYVVSTGVDGSPINMMDMLYGAPPQVIHPSRKSPLGYRTADRVLVELFGRSDEILTAPRLTKIEKGEGIVTLTFDTALRLLRGVTPEDFQVYDSATSSWVKVSAVISGNTVVLDTSALTAPTQVRYGFGGRFIELATGELIRLNVDSRFTLNIDENGVRYAEYIDTDVSPSRVFTFYSEDGQIIRTIKSGNLTNASGEPMPTFVVSIP